MVKTKEFFDFLEAPSTTGEALADLLLGQIGMYGLDPNFIRGQGYDGAANMSGKQRALLLVKTNGFL